MRAHHHQSPPPAKHRWAPRQMGPRSRAHVSEGEGGSEGRRRWGLGATARRRAAIMRATAGARAVRHLPSSILFFRVFPASASSHPISSSSTTSHPRPPLQFHTKHTGKSIATKNPRFPLRDCAPLPPSCPRRRREEEPTIIRLWPLPSLPSPPSPGPGDPIGRGLAGKKKKNRARVDTQQIKGSYPPEAATGAHVTIPPRSPVSLARSSLPLPDRALALAVPFVSLDRFCPAGLFVLIRSLAGNQE